MWLLTTVEGLNNSHGPAAIRARFPQSKRDDIGVWRVIRFGRFCAKQGQGLSNVGLGGGTGQHAVVTDAMEAVWEDVDQETADKLTRG